MSDQVKLTIKDLITQIAVGLILVAVTTGFIQISKMPTTEQVRSMIQRESPYIRDKDLIIYTIKENTQVTRDLKAAVIELRIEVEKLKNTN